MRVRRHASRSVRYDKRRAEARSNWKKHDGVAIGVSTMIVRGGGTGRSLWLYIAALSVILCLVFLFYEAKTRPAQPTTPTSPPLHDSK